MVTVVAVAVVMTIAAYLCRNHARDSNRTIVVVTAAVVVIIMVVVVIFHKPVTENRRRRVAAAAAAVVVVVVVVVVAVTVSPGVSCRSRSSLAMEGAASSRSSAGRIIDEADRVDAAAAANDDDDDDDDDDGCVENHRQRRVYPLCMELYNVESSILGSV
jgi:CBS domain containing-hemolysin-like protein